jgi:hypothetical protein
LYFDLCTSVFISDTGSTCAEIDANSIKSWADEILGAESIGEYQVILKKLGARPNWVFQAFKIKALPRVAAIRHRATEEKKKLKKEKAQEAKASGSTSATAHLESK